MKVFIVCCMDSQHTDQAQTIELQRVALQEVARTTRDLRAALVEHLKDNQLHDGMSPAELSTAALGALTDMVLNPERYGLDAYGLQF